MYINNLISEFPDDKTKVTFVMSYLKGSPLDWFQLELKEGITKGGKLPEWYSSFPDFITELETLFGPCDSIDDAINALENLKYRDTGKVT